MMTGDGLVAALDGAEAFIEGPAPLVQIAGPHAENALDQAPRLLAARGEGAQVVGVPASESMRAGPTCDQRLAEVEGRGTDR